MTLNAKMWRDLLFAQYSICHCRRLQQYSNGRTYCSSTVTCDRKPSKLKKKTCNGLNQKSTALEKNSFSIMERRNLSPDVLVLLKAHRNVLAKTVIKASGTYILDKTIASDIVSHLNVKKLKEGEIIFEANPGPGVITQQLLEAGVPTLRVFEKQKVFIPYLQKIQSQYPSKLEVVEENFLDLSKIELKHRLSLETTMDSVFKGVQVAEWKDDPPLKIFAILPKKTEVLFLRFILAKLPRFQSLFSLGRTQLLLFVSGKEYLSMTAQPKDKFVAYRNSSVLFQIFFHISLLRKEPVESFFPPTATKCTKKIKYDCNNMYLISVTPKRHLFELVSPNLILELTFFIRHHLMKRKRLIFQSLEQWIPGCTSRLAAEGLDVHSMFGELTPDEILMLFLNFSSLPEYSESLFRTAARKDVDHYNYNWTPEDVKEAAAEDVEFPVEELLTR